MSFSEYISPLLGRLGDRLVFPERGLYARGQLGRHDLADGDEAYSRAPPLFALALLAMVVGGLSLLFGYHVRHAAMLLFGFTIVARW